MEDQSFAIRMDQRNQADLNFGYFNLGLFTDCTLVAKCGRFLKAHRIVLSASSDFLAKILLIRSSDLGPIVVFSDIVFEDLERAVEFMYKGSITLGEKDLDGFMQTVDALQIKNVMPGSPCPQLTFENLETSSSDASSDSDRSSYLEPIVEISTSCPKPNSKNSKQKLKSAANQTPSNHEESQVNKSFASSVLSPPELHKQKRKKKKFTKPKTPPVRYTNPDNQFPCKFCSQRLKTPRSLSTHQLACYKNPKRRVFTCEICQQAFTRKIRLFEHMKIKHM